MPKPEIAIKKERSSFVGQVGFDGNFPNTAPVQRKNKQKPSKSVYEGGSMTKKVELVNCKKCGTLNDPEKFYCKKDGCNELLPVS